MYASETTDRMLLRRFLSQKPMRSAYLLGVLDPAFFRFTRWFAAMAEPRKKIGAVAMLYSGFRLPMLITHGDAHLLEGAVEAAQPDIPEQIYLQVARAHDAVLGQSFELDGLRSILRMGLTKDGYQADDACCDGVEPLGHPDTAALMELYRTYPDAFFEPYQLESGHYCGIREGDRLLSAAGVHTLSAEFGIGVIGNVVTMPDQRGKGLAKRCVHHVLRSLFEKVPTVALNVPERDHGARRLFSSIGFEQVERMLEGLAPRRI